MFYKCFSCEVSKRGDDECLGSSAILLWNSSFRRADCVLCLGHAFESKKWPSEARGMRLFMNAGTIVELHKTVCAETRLVHTSYIHAFESISNFDAFFSHSLIAFLCFHNTFRADFSSSRNVRVGNASQSRHVSVFSCAAHSAFHVFPPSLHFWFPLTVTVNPKIKIHEFFVCW